MRFLMWMTRVIVLLAVIALFTGVAIDSRASVYAEPLPPCTVTINKVSPADATMNVAQLAQFKAQVFSGGGSPVTFQWSVDGDILKDYEDRSRTPGAPDLYRSGFKPTPMGAADFKSQTIQFYWGPDPTQIDPLAAGPVARHVRVTVTAGTQSCADDKAFNVERNNTDPRRDAEHWYTSNHPDSVGSPGRVLGEHAGWHNDWMFWMGPPPPNAKLYNGNYFFMFHRMYIATFNSWRIRFGYPPIGASYDPNTPIPTGVDVDHIRTGCPGPLPAMPCPAGTNPGQLKPSWFTAAGSAATRTPNGDPCDTLIGGERKLKDFPADQKLLGCAVTDNWHNDVHMAIGGDMTDASVAPADPIFWRWHKFVDQISKDRSGSCLFCINPKVPLIESMSPAPFYQWVTSLPLIELTFDNPVSGVSAGDIIVNSSPATLVTGSGAGPYVFTGFEAPALGNVSVALVPGSIVGPPADDEDIAGVAALADEWTYDLLDPGGSAAGDTLTVSEKMLFNLNPTRADSFEDGIPDGWKLAYPCTAALVYMNVDMPMDMAGNMLPPITDPDAATIHTAFQLGTNPCPPVGGVTDLALGTSGDSLATDYVAYVGLAFGAAVLAAAGWFARRRWVK
jgi:hypothetical protein